MNYKINSLPIFDKQAKRLAKKYPSLKSDLIILVAKLADNPEMGTALGNGFYKIRMSIASKSKGKSGGARVITFLKVIHHTIYLASIFDKSEKNTISKKELEEIFKLLP